MLASAAQKLIVVLGSTGTGKSKLAIDIAKRIAGAEVVNGDAMQLYEGLDILTNKVTMAEQSGIPHHLMGFLHPLTFGYTILNFLPAALQVLGQIWARNGVPILVGGTNYYIEKILWRMALEDDDDICGENISLMEYGFFERGLPREYAKLTTEGLYAELQRIDPDMSTFIHPSEWRRVQRSLQIFYIKGRRHSDLLREWREINGSECTVLRYKDVCALWTKCDWSTLDRRINERSLQMVDRGLKNEICEFYDRFFPEYDTKLEKIVERQVEGRANAPKGVFQSVGVREFLPFLNLPRDESDSEFGREIFDDCLRSLCEATQRCARGQAKWISSKFLGRPSREQLPIFGIDTSDLSQWNEKILEPSLSIVSAFLSNQRIPFEPLPCTENAYEDHLRDILRCSICTKHCAGLQTYQSHLRSKWHRINKKKWTKKMNAISKFLDKHCDYLKSKQQMNEVNAGTCYSNNCDFG